MTNDNNPNDAPGLGGAGAELDAKVASKLGYPVVANPRGQGYGIYVKPPKFDPYFLPIPSYSTDIELAWKIAETEKLALLPTPDGKWFCGKLDFSLITGSDFYAPERGYIEHGFKYYEIADTAPLAICLAFLALPDEVIRKGNQWNLTN